MAIVKWDWDLAIFATFLIINLIVGLTYSRNVKNIRDYAIGNRDFSTATIAATLIATWISGSAFLTDISEAYQDGLFYMVPGMLGDILSCIIICYFLAPRMGEFLGNLSVADAMGKLYGEKVRLVTSLSSTFNCIGKVAAQFKVSATILQLFFGISSFAATLASCIIVIIYSTFGGIRAVTFTDIIQFFTFGTIIPIIALIIWGTFNDPYIVFETLSNNPKFDYHQLFDYNHPKFWGSLTLAIYFIIPSLNPAIFQRIAMARDTQQVSRSFFIATSLRLCISIMFFWIGILLFSRNPNLEPNKLFNYIIDNYTYIGLKGCMAAGMMAMVMSTADSYINAATVTFSYDLRKSLGIDLKEKYNLPLSYICSCFIGILAFFLAFHMKGLLSLFLMVSSFYLPIVTVPLLAAIFGFRSTATSVLIGMSAGLITVLIWRNFFLETGIDSVIPGTLGNLIFFFGSHYILNQKGGWVGILDTKPLILARSERKRSIKRLINSFKEFSLINFLKSNLPREEITYTYLGFFIITSTYSSLYTLPEEARNQYKDIYNFIYHSVLFASTGLLTYPIWPPTFKNENFIAAYWNTGIFYILICVGSALVIIGNFGQMQLMIFLLNLIVTGMILRWEATIVMSITGTFLTIEFFKNYMQIVFLPGEFGNVKFKIIYSLLLFTSALIAFLKPKQKYDTLSEVMRKQLEVKEKQQQKDLVRLLQHQVEFVKNLDNGSIEIFRSANDKVKNIQNELLQINSEQDLKSTSEKLVKVTETLEAGAAYLFDVINAVKDFKQIKLNKVNPEDFINNIIEEYIIYHNNGPYLILDNKIGQKEIECDPYLIRQVIEAFLDHISKDDKGSIINISLENSRLEYNLSFTDKYTKKIEAVKVSITNDNKFLTPSQIESLLTPSLKATEDVAFTEIYRIIYAHYGSFEIKNNNSHGVTYSFSLPSNIKEVRPKVMDLPDIRLDNLDKISELLATTEKKEMIRVAIKLLNMGLDIYEIAEVTRLSIEEIKKLKN
jgi:Na+/proline symporter